jgi:hypothetical protein
MKKKKNKIMYSNNKDPLVRYNKTDYIMSSGTSHVTVFTHRGCQRSPTKLVYRRLHRGGQRKQVKRLLF